ncbi:MAG: ATP-binding protein [Polyangiales bacterium]|nr:hypothetical protein [Myxococcales bacterium]
MSDSDLEFITSVRKRPGMYVGDPYDGSGLHHLLRELLANALDQFYVGRLTRIDVSVLADGRLRVEDDGRGISTARDADGRTFLERVFTTRHTTPTADGHAPHWHLADVGLGLAPVCALSAALLVQVRNADGCFRRTFACGVATGDLVRTGPATTTGATVELLPDPDIFPRPAWDPARIDPMLRELASLCPGLTTSFAFERRRYGPFEDLRDLVCELGDGRPRPEDVILCSADDGPMSARVGLWFSNPAFGAPPREASYCNLLKTHAGTHLDGFRRGLVDAVASAAGARSRGRTTAAYDRVARGLVAVISVTLVDPSYGAPTKDQLTTPAARGLVERAVREGFGAALAKDPQLAASLTERLAR